MRPRTHCRLPRPRAFAMGIMLDWAFLWLKSNAPLMISVSSLDSSPPSFCSRPQTRPQTRRLGTQGQRSSQARRIQGSGFSECECDVPTDRAR